MIRFAFTIFLSAFLLFQVQPLIGKFILPWFGGGSNIWTSCLLFFQVALLVGYGYAHGMGQILGRKAQAWLHVSLLGLSLIFLPIIPHQETWSPSADSSPTLQIVLLLSGVVGLPFILLSTTGPLLQHWFSQSFPGRSPYRLYALSNIGSLLALVTYPFLVEPKLRLGTQATVWSICYAVFCLWAAYCAIRYALTPEQTELVTPPPAQAKSRKAAADPPRAPKVEIKDATYGQMILWVKLAAVGSMMLIATTNQITQEVAAFPFLWIMPLAIYLLTFIICFDQPILYQRWIFGPLFASSCLFTWFTLRAGVNMSVSWQLINYGMALFSTCMICHGELVKSRPAPRQLTLFYFCVSLGGALGGTFVALAAPLLFMGFWEFQLSLAAAAILASICVSLKDSWVVPLFAAVGICAGILIPLETIVTWSDLDQIQVIYKRLEASGFSELTRKEIHTWMIKGWGWIPALLTVYLFAGPVSLALMMINKRALFWGWLCPAVALLCVLLVADIRLTLDQDETDSVNLTTRRNFYGVLRVKEETNRTLDKDKNIIEDYSKHELIHGRINHGFQYTDPIKSTWSTSYYGGGSGVWIAIQHHPRRYRGGEELSPLRVGVVGLGTGTLASACQDGDKLTFYEINKEVKQLSDEGYFTYLKDSRAEVDVRFGDARIVMQRELEAGEPQGYDVLAVDAFSSDAIPFHLLTKECGEIYKQHLKEDGILALHISNRFLHLEPITRGLAKELGMEAVRISGPSNDYGVSQSTWVLLTNNQEFIQDQGVVEATEDWRDRPEDDASADVPLPDPVNYDLPPMLWTDDFTSLWPIIQWKN